MWSFQGITGGFLASYGREACTRLGGGRAFHSEDRLHTFIRAFLPGASAGVARRLTASLQILTLSRYLTASDIRAENAERIALLRGFHQVGETRQIGTHRID